MIGYRYPLACSCLLRAVTWIATPECIAVVGKEHVY